jgi:hypothetical protein
MCDIGEPIDGPKEVPPPEISEFEQRLLQHPDLVAKIQAGIDSGVRYSRVDIDLDELP